MIYIATYYVNCICHVAALFKSYKKYDLDSVNYIISLKYLWMIVPGFMCCAGPLVASCV